MKPLTFGLSYTIPIREFLSPTIRRRRKKEKFEKTQAVTNKLCM